MLLDNHVPALYQLLMMQMPNVRIAVLRAPERFAVLADHDRLNGVKSCLVTVMEEKRRLAMLDHLVHVRVGVNNDARLINIKRIEHLCKPNHAAFVVVALNNQQPNFFMFLQRHSHHRLDHLDHVSDKLLVSRVGIQNVTACIGNSLQAVKVREVTQQVNHADAGCWRDLKCSAKPFVEQIARDAHIPIVA
ncbi:hypothetical protein F414_gp34 [Cronobacter phage ESP2949-1]|uniref:Uncharacterized protein n=1 Tax=Cronobacter phage ESP2949-1 TaxID=2920894 RepID=G1CST1_9CAUD|nr:hypothetical protein F414_gp34 [Cronobacter phage ESP2949-1]AEM24790.1 hypothetical protein [Cronobacter phage ESP2949-1]